MLRCVAGRALVERPNHVDDPEHGGGGVTATHDIERALRSVIDRYPFEAGEEPGAAEGLDGPQAPRRVRLAGDEGDAGPVGQPAQRRGDGCW